MVGWWEYWPLFPAAVAISCLGLTFSIESRLGFERATEAFGGAAFFSPLFLVLFPALGWKALPPQYAFTAATATQLAGFTSGSVGYGRRGLIDFYAAIPLLLVAVPSTVIGVILRHVFLSSISPRIVLAILSSGFFGLGFYSLYAYLWKRGISLFRCCGRAPSNTSPASAPDIPLDESSIPLTDMAGSEDPADLKATPLDDSNLVDLKEAHDGPIDPTDFPSPSPSRISPFLSLSALKSKIYEPKTYKDDAGKVLTYTFTFPWKAVALVGFGALSTGFRSIGISEAASTALNILCGLPPLAGQATAVFTAAVILWITVLCDFILLGSRLSEFPWPIVAWMGPAVIVGAQFGSLIASRLKSDSLERGQIAIYFLLSLSVAAIAVSGIDL